MSYLKEIPAFGFPVLGVTAASLRDQQQTRMRNALPQRRGYSMKDGVNC
jgi:hypothetical protein